MDLSIPGNRQGHRHGRDRRVCQSHGMLLGESRLLRSAQRRCSDSLRWEIQPCRSAAATRPLGCDICRRFRYQRGQLLHPVAADSGMICGMLGTTEGSAIDMVNRRHNFPTHARRIASSGSGGQPMIGSNFDQGRPAVVCQLSAVGEEDHGDARAVQDELSRSTVDVHSPWDLTSA